MAHSEICPICKGSGKIKKDTCHGCGGKGWIEVNDYNIQIPPIDTAARRSAADLPYCCQICMNKYKLLNDGYCICDIPDRNNITYLFGGTAWKMAVQTKYHI